ncbi:MAG: hypothetical protein OEP95_12055 [Myxococcales bacterium]|nr:hypothetical protein [Myxococcales bacterium]
MRRLAAATLPALFLGAAIPAGAAFHIAHISEVLTSLGGDASIQFVEI